MFLRFTNIRVDFRANQHAISRAQKIQKWTVLPRDFSIHGGELGRNPLVDLRRLRGLAVILVSFSYIRENLPK